MTRGAGPDDHAAWLERIRAAADPGAAAGIAARAVAALAAEAPALLLALKDASKATLAVDPSRAVALADALLAGAAAAGLPWFQALGRMARGDAYSAQGGRVADAVAELDAAAEAFLGLGDRVAWARTRIGWIYLRTLAGLATEDDFAAAEEAREVLAEADAPALAVTLDRNLMLCHWQRGQLDRAEACFGRAMATAGGTGDAPDALEEAGLRANRGLMLTGQARLAEALAEHERARQLYAQLGQGESLRRQEHNLGHLYLVMGDEGRALTHFYRALALTAGEGRALPRGMLLANIARCHLSLGLVAEGVAEAREALGILSDQGAGAEALRCRLTLAQGLSASGAAAAAREAETLLFSALDDPILAGLRAQDGLLRLDLAELALRRGDVAAASRWAQEARARFQSGSLTLLDLLAALVTADCLLAAGHSAEAGAAAAQLRAEAEARGLPALLPRSWHLTARAAEAQGRDREARAAYASAADALDLQLQRLPPLLRTHALDNRRSLFADALACYHRSAEVDDLWWMLERTKAQAQSRWLRQRGAPGPHDGDLGAESRAEAVAEAVAAARAAGPAGPPPPDLPAELRHAEQLQADLFSLRHAPDWLPGPTLRAPPGAAELAALDQRLAEAEHAVLRLREQLALAGGPDERGSTVPRRRVDWAAPEAPEGTVLAAFGLTADKTFVLLARGDKRAAVDLPLDGAALGSLVEAWVEAVEDAGAQAAAGLPAAALVAPLRAPLGRLYQALVAPWQAWLEGATRLVVLPQGALHALPFGALHDGGRYLVERLELGGAPSLAWWRACGGRGPARPRGLVAAFSHDEALPGAAEEARQVAEVLGLEPLLEAAARRDTVLAGAQGAGLLHLAAHAAARQDRPAFAHLWLADGALLSSHDLAGLDLRGALVTLSGCETGQGQLTAADEVLSLGGACLQAGAATVLSTLWPLRDAAALPLMRRVYAGLGVGLPVGAALRQAQLEALAGPWPSPLDWAAFQCLGSCDTMLPDTLTQEVPA